MCDTEWFEAYRNTNKMIYFTSAERLSDIFKKRFDALTIEINTQSPPGNYKSWKEAYDTLIAISENLCNRSRGI